MTLAQQETIKKAREERSLQESLALVDRLMPPAEKLPTIRALEAPLHPLCFRMERNSVAEAVEAISSLPPEAGDSLGELLGKHYVALSLEIVRRMGGIPEEASTFTLATDLSVAVVNAIHCVGVYKGYTAAVDYLSDLTDRVATYAYNMLVGGRLGAEWARPFLASRGGA